MSNEQSKIEVTVEEKSVINYLLQKARNLSQQLEMTRAEINQSVTASANRLGINLEVSQNGSSWQYEESGTFIEIEVPSDAVEVKNDI
tara:strand:- start:2336 stop:2599 length:264 start_codon:yes stop_codon:yes gene_type:complete